MALSVRVRLPAPIFVCKGDFMFYYELDNRSCISNMKGDRNEKEITLAKAFKTS